MTEGEESQDALLGTVAGGAIWSFGGRVAKLTLLFVVEIVMARFLGLSSYGGITLAVVAINVGTTVGGLGLSRGISRKVPLYENEREKARGAIQSGLGLALVGGIVVGGGTFLAAPIIANDLVNDPELVTLFRVAGLAIPLSVLIGIGTSTARAFNDATTHVAVNQLFVPLSRAIVVPGLIAVGFGAVYATTGIAATIGLGGLLALYLGFRHVPFELRGPQTPMAREMLVFSVPLMLASGMQFIVTNTDTILVGTFLATESVGVYNASLKLMNLAWLFFYPVGFLLGPVLTRLDRDGRMVEAKRTYQVAAKWASLATFPIFVGLFLFPEVAIGITFGSDATVGATALRILVLPVMFSVLLGVNDGALVAFGHNKIHMYGNAATAAVNVVLNVALIPTYGIAGAAIATALSLGMRNVIYSARLYQSHGVHPFSRALGRSLGTMVPVVAIGYYAFVTLFPVRFVTVAAVGLLFLAVYALVVVRVGGIEQEDIDVANRFEQNKDLDLTVLRSIVKRLQA